MNIGEQTTKVYELETNFIPVTMGQKETSRSLGPQVRVLAADTVTMGTGLELLLVVKIKHQVPIRELF